MVDQGCLVISDRQTVQNHDSRGIQRLAFIDSSRRFVLVSKQALTYKSIAIPSTIDLVTYDGLTSPSIRRSSKLQPSNNPKVADKTDRS